MDTIHSVTHLAEGLLLAGFLSAAGRLAKPLTEGKQARTFQAASLGVLLSESLQWLPLRGRAKRWAGAASSLLGLASGFALRWSMVHAGRESAANPEAARQASRRQHEVRFG